MCHYRRCHTFRRHRFRRHRRRHIRGSRDVAPAAARAATAALPVAAASPLRCPLDCTLAVWVRFSHTAELASAIGAAAIKFSVAV